MKTDFEKGQIIGATFGIKGTKTCMKYRRMAELYSPECLRGFNDGMRLAIETLEKCLYNKKVA